MVDYNKLSVKEHKDKKGKLEIKSKFKVSNKDELSIAYTPGVAEVCLEIVKDKRLAKELTSTKFEKMTIGYRRCGSVRDFSGNTRYRNRKYRSPFGKNQVSNTKPISIVLVQFETIPVWFESLGSDTHCY